VEADDGVQRANSAVTRSSHVILINCFLEGVSEMYKRYFSQYSNNLELDNSSVHLVNLLYNMSPQSLDFQCALVTGGAGGIGRAFAEYFISEGKKVIICGRTESKLLAASKEIGADYYVLDTGDIQAIPAFLKKITQDHPELDCLVNNAGVVCLPRLQTP
jgi:hypothetical protein